MEGHRGRGGGKREEQVVSAGQSPPQAPAAPKGSHWVSNPDLGATSLHPHPSVPFSAIAPRDGCNVCAGEHGTAGTEIPWVHLTSLLKVWRLGLEAGQGRATSPLPLAAMGLPVPACLTLSALPPSPAAASAEKHSPPLRKQPITNALYSHIH